jgi:hypothetical protein
MIDKLSNREIFFVSRCIAGSMKPMHSAIWKLAEKNIDNHVSP